MSERDTKPKKDHGKSGREHRPETGDLSAAAKLSDDELDSYSKSTGHVVGASREGAGVRIVINLGSKDGIGYGTPGKVVGLGTSFIVNEIFEKRCAAFVEATYEEIDAHKTVVLTKISPT